MSSDTPLVGIDVGSSSVRVVVAEAEPHRLVIKGCGEARHDGARKGVIATLDEVSSAVRDAAEEAEAMASFPVEVGIVGLAGLPIQGCPAMASVPVMGRGSSVCAEDVSRALSSCARVSVPEDFRILDIIPCDFALDGQPGLRNPEGMSGRRLEASAYVLYTGTAHAEIVEQAVNRAAVAMSDLYFEPLAASEVVLSADERELGCLIVDIGYATTDWVLWSEGAVVATGCSPIGGRHFTADVAEMLKTNTVDAERVKREVGVDLARDDLEFRAVDVPSRGGGGLQVFQARFAAEVLYDRACELFIGIARTLAAAGLERTARAGVVLTGGGARLDGLDGVAETTLGQQVRIGLPNHLAGEVEPVAGPEWSVACGLVRLAQRRRENFYVPNSKAEGLGEKIRVIFGQLFDVNGRWT
jgi:cell division protein FtsA